MHRLKSPSVAYSVTDKNRRSSRASICINVSDGPVPEVLDKFLELHNPSPPLPTHHFPPPPFSSHSSSSSSILSSPLLPNHSKVGLLQVFFRTRCIYTAAKFNAYFGNSKLSSKTFYEHTVCYIVVSLALVMLRLRTSSRPPENTP